MRFSRVVEALTEVLLLERGETRGDIKQRVCAFILAQHGRMPDYLRLPIACLTMVFDLWPVLLHGKPFHSQSSESKRLQIAAWKRSRLGVRRDLIKFYESLAVFGWCAEIYGPNSKLT